MRSVPPQRNCKYCGETFWRSLTICPHCGQPSLFPNCEAAAEASQIQALQIRYDQAIADGKARGCEAEVLAFQNEVKSSEAVINRFFGEVCRLAYSDDEIYATFYQRIEGGMRVPGGGSWDRLRAMADTALFGDVNKREIRFGALTLDGFGLSHYGDCSIVLKTCMIEHRASVFTENTVIFMRNHNLQAANGYAIPDGYQAPWDARAIIAVAKMANEISPSTKPTDFPELLLRPGPSGSSDRFVEVHIWGSLTIRSVSKVTVKNWVMTPSGTELKVLEKNLARANVGLKIP